MGILDTFTGELSPTIDIEKLLQTEPGGVIAGNSCYPLLAKLAPEIKRDEGWTMSVNLQQRRTRPMDSTETRITGRIYISRMTYRRAKVGGRKNRRRPPAIKWVVLELGLFMETPPSDLDGVLAAAMSLTELAGRRGISPRPSPGSLGSAMLRASSEWNKERKAAPEFISEVARDHLPGNYYALSNKTKGKSIPHVYYMDQEASHHKIASSIPIPFPGTLRARGYFRAAENEIYRPWTNDLRKLRGHFGLVLGMVQCGIIPHSMEHLYPPWAKERGMKPRWIWTPELRLFENDHRLSFEYAICALTSRHIDTALWEYSEWALEQRKRSDRDPYKSSLLAAYGMLACRSDRPIDIYTVHGRAKPPRATVVELPLLPEVFRSEVKRKRAPTIQNVVARGVIEAETRTRSIEYARQLEGEGIPVAQIYADGLLAVTDQAPLIVPEHWRIAASLTRVYSPHPNSIVSRELVRLPGIIGSAQNAYASAWEPGAVRERIEQIPAQIAGT
jgi:hypothetical protein